MCKYLNCFILRAYSNRELTVTSKFGCDLIVAFGATRTCLEVCKLVVPHSDTRRDECVFSKCVCHRDECVCDLPANRDRCDRGRLKKTNLILIAGCPCDYYLEWL